MKQYDVIVIGAGNGGLAAAATFAEHGKKVAVFEKHNIPGGCGTSFRRGRFEFEVALHQLSSMGTPEKPGELRQQFKRYGIEDKIDWIEIKELFRVNFPDGQLRGAVIEVTHEGTVRGYVRRKVLPELDDADISDKELFRKAIGCKAQCAVIVSDRSGADTHAVFGCGFEDHLSVTDILEEYFNNSLQRRAYAQISAASEDGHVACAHALLCEFMPEADQSACGDVEKRFDDGSVQAAMDRGADIAEIAALLGVTPTGFEEKPIRFACTCSDEKVIAMLRTLPKEDREALIAKGEPTDIYCHMCGRGFTITPEQLKAL